MIPTPFTAYMRNGRAAHIKGIITLGADDRQHYLQGSHEQQTVELWGMDGRWSERNGASHDFDLMQVRSASGQIYAINRQPKAATP